MPYMKVKVCQDLYEELGLCPNMELVRSNSEGSIKFVPLPSKSVFGYYDSPLLTSPIFGDCMQEPEHSNSSVLTGQASNDGVIRSISDELCENASHNNPSEGGNTLEDIVSEECTDLNQPVSFKDEVPVTVENVSNPGSTMDVSDEEIEAVDNWNSFVQKDNPTVNLSPIAIPVGNSSHFERFTSASKLSSSVLNIEADNVCCIELDSRGHLSSVTLAAPPELSKSTSTQQRFSCEAFYSSALSSDTPLECKVCSKKYSSDVSFSRHLKNCDKRIKYPRACENCFSVYKHCSSFIRHKKSCEEAKQKRLKGAALKSACGSGTLQSELKQKKVKTYPRICDKCGLIFEESRAFRYHLKKCEAYRGTQTISSNTERIILLPGAPAPVSSNIDLGINSEAKYIPLKKGSESSCRFFIRKKAPTDSD